MVLAAARGGGGGAAKTRGLRRTSQMISASANRPSAIATPALTNMVLRSLSPRASTSGRPGPFVTAQYSTSNGSPAMRPRRISALIQSLP